MLGTTVIGTLDRVSFSTVVKVFFHSNSFLLSFCLSFLDLGKLKTHLQIIQSETKELFRFKSNHLQTHQSDVGFHVTNYIIGSSRFMICWLEPLNSSV